MAQTTMEKIWKQMNKNFGEESLYKADSDLIETVKVSPTGSQALNEALGVWGLPQGRIVQFAGKESSGKTLMSLIAIREWQKKDPKNWAFFIDAEQTFDPEWAKVLGVDLSRLQLFKENDGVMIFERLCGVPHKEYGKEKAKLGLLDLIKATGGAEKSGCGLIVLDSIACVQPPMEKQSKPGKPNMALMGRFLPPELRKLIPLLAETGVIFIAINQVRVDPGQLWGNPEKSTGGSAWKHGCSVMVHFARLENKDSKIYDSRGDLIGYTMRTRIDKNKVGPPFKSCDIRIEFLKGPVDENLEVFELAKKYSILERPTNTSYVYGDQKWVGKDNAAKALLDDNLRNEIIQKIKDFKLNDYKQDNSKQELEQVPDEEE